jgi:hypothetical protein
MEALLWSFWNKYPFLAKKEEERNKYRLHKTHMYAKLEQSSFPLNHILWKQNVKKAKHMNISAISSHGS